MKLRRLKKNKKLSAMTTVGTTGLLASGAFSLIWGIKSIIVWATLGTTLGAVLFIAIATHMTAQVLIEVLSFVAEIMSSFGEAFIFILGHAAEAFMGFLSAIAKVISSIDFD